MQMAPIDSILGFVMGNREMRLLLEENVESRKKFKTDVLEHVFLLLEVSGREGKIMFLGKKRSSCEGGRVRPAPAEVCSGQGAGL